MESIFERNRCGGIIFLKRTPGGHISFVHMASVCEFDNDVLIMGYVLCYTPT